MISRFWLVVALMLAQPASPAAACHRFHIWRFPHPQRCSVSSSHLHASAAAKGGERVGARSPSTPTADVPVFILPSDPSPVPLSDEEQRRRAIEALKVMMAK